MADFFCAAARMHDDRVVYESGGKQGDVVAGGIPQ